MQYNLNQPFKHITNQVWEHVYVDCPSTINNHFLKGYHERITVEFRPPYSSFLNPIEEFFWEWRWKAYDHRPQDQMSLLDAMNAVCEDITADHRRGWRFPSIPCDSAWQWKTSDVMFMKIFGLTKKSDRMSIKNTFFHGCYFVFLCICGT